MLRNVSLLRSARAPPSPQWWRSYAASSKRGGDATEEELDAARKWLAQLDPDTIPRSICDISFSRSSGPGGQNVNKYAATPRAPRLEVSSLASVVPIADRISTLPESPPRLPFASPPPPSCLSSLHCFAHTSWPRAITLPSPRSLSSKPTALESRRRM